MIMGIISKNDQNHNIIRHERNICCCVKNNVINKIKVKFLLMAFSRLFQEDTVNSKKLVKWNFFLRQTYLNK